MRKSNDKLRSGLLLLAIVLGSGPRGVIAQQPNQKPSVHHLSADKGADGSYYMMEDGKIVKTNNFHFQSVVKGERGKDNLFILNSGTYTLGKSVQRLGFKIIGAEGHENILDLTEAAKEYDPAEKISSEKDTLKLGPIAFELKEIAYVQIGKKLIPVPTGKFGPEFGQAIETAFKNYLHELQATAFRPSGPAVFALAS